MREQGYTGQQLDEGPTDESTDGSMPGAIPTCSSGSLVHPKDESNAKRSPKLMLPFALSRLKRLLGHVKKLLQAWIRGHRRRCSAVPGALSGRTTTFCLLAHATCRWMHGTCERSSDNVTRQPDCSVARAAT